MAGAEPALDVARQARRLVLFGPPGSGKGTQAQLLSRRLSVPAISTGDMLREAVAAGTALGGKVEETMLAGELVDDDTMGEVVAGRLAQPDARPGFILDGYPRTLPQAATLEHILERQDRWLDAVILLEVPEEVLVDRALQRRRADDSEAVIRERLEVYRNKTEPLVGYYQARDLLYRVDGDRPVEEVTGGILAVLERAA